jgi:hypothetical protein
MFWIRGYTTASLEFTKTFSHRSQLRDDNGEWPRTDFHKGLFLFFIYFNNSRNKNRVFIYFIVRFDLLYFNLKNNREKLQSHQDTMQNLRIKKNVHFLYLKREIIECINVGYKQLHFNFKFFSLFYKISFIRTFAFCLI